MNDLGDPHRRWLDAAMPDAATQRADLEATRAAIGSRGGARWRVGAMMSVAGVAAIAIVMVVRRETPAIEVPPAMPAVVDWGVRLALHVDGRSADDDVRIQIAVRKEPTP